MGDRQRRLQNRTGPDYFIRRLQPHPSCSAQARLGAPVHLIPSAYLTLDLLLQAQLLLLVLVGTADLLLNARQHNLTAYAPVGIRADEKRSAEGSGHSRIENKTKAKASKASLQLDWTPSSGHLGTSQTLSFLLSKPPRAG